MRRGWMLGVVLWAAALASAQAPDPKARLEALAVEMRDLAADKQLKQTAKLFEAAAAIHELGEDA